MKDKPRELFYKNKTWRVTLVNKDFTIAHLVLKNSKLSKTTYISIDNNGDIEQKEARTILEKHRYDYKELEKEELYKIIEYCLKKSELKQTRTNQFKKTSEGKLFRSYQSKRNNSRSYIRKNWKLRKNKDIRGRIKKHINKLRAYNTEFFNEYGLVKETDIEVRRRWERYLEKVRFRG